MKNTIIASLLFLITSYSHCQTKTGIFKYDYGEFVDSNCYSVFTKDGEGFSFMNADLKEFGSMCKLKEEYQSNEFLIEYEPWPDNSYYNVIKSISIYTPEEDVESKKPTEPQESGQKSVIAIIKSIGIDNAEGSNSPYIEYVNELDEDITFWYEIQHIAMQGYSVIKIGDEPLIKVLNATPISDEYPGILEFEYDFNESLAQKLIGKKIRINYYHQLDENHIMGYIDYLGSIELAE